jgi:hypothetical protein
MPNGRYKGQKLMNEVAMNTIANIPSTNANVPEMALVKYNMPMANAIDMRMILSAVPIFVFIPSFIG